MSKPKPGIEIVFLFCNVEALKTHRNHQLEWPCTPRTPRVENFGRPLGEVNGFQALFVLGFAKLETGWWFEPYPSEKYELKSVGIMTFPILYIFFLPGPPEVFALHIPNIWKNKTCSKPPTRRSFTIDQSRRWIDTSVSRSFPNGVSQCIQSGGYLYLQSAHPPSFECINAFFTYSYTML